MVIRLSYCSFYSLIPKKDISIYQKSWWCWLINFLFTMYVVTFHFEAKIHQNSVYDFCCCNLWPFLRANSYYTLSKMQWFWLSWILPSFFFMHLLNLQCYFKFDPFTVLILSVFMIYYFHFPNLPLLIFLSLLKRKPCVAKILNLQALNLKSTCNWINSFVVI